MPARSARLVAEPDRVFDTFEEIAKTNSFATRRAAQRLLIQAPLGTVTFDAGKEDIALRFETASPSELQLFTDLYAQRFEKAGLSEVLSWDAVAETVPLNQFMCRVVAKTRLSPNFMRVRLSGEFGPFLRDDAGLHFRLLFGPEAGVWPTLDAGGLTQWPGGAGAWHRPPYTSRAIDPNGSWIDVDIVLHAGGRVTEWCLAVEEGSQIALNGPSGSKQPKASWLGLFGDETALPVIAQMVSRVPDGTAGQAMIVVRDPADVQEVATKSDIALTWVTDGDMERALEALRVLTPPPEDRYVFFAGERQDATAARGILKELGLVAGESKAASYWPSN